MKKFSLAAGLMMLACVLSGCDKDNRPTEEKLVAPAPDFNTRCIMACPKCGAPTKAYRINSIKSFYKCSGQPPKFWSHDEKRWSHNISQSPKSLEQ